jgi:hypothetical protein
MSPSKAEEFHWLVKETKMRRVHCSVAGFKNHEPI